MKSMFGMGIAHTFRRGLLLLLVGCAAATASASTRQESGDLTKPTVKPTKRSAPREALPGRFRSINLNPKVFDRGSFDVTLFPGETVRLDRDHLTQLPNGDRVWSGHITGEPLSRATFAIRRGVVSGVIDRAMSTGNELYEIAPAAGSGYHLFQHSESKGSAMGLGDPLPAPTPTGRQALPATTPPNEGVHVIEVMVVYTPASRVRYGQAGIEAKILQSVADANTAMKNSQIQAQFSLVHMGEVAYTETGSMSTALMAMQRTSDGVLDGIHALRDQYGADLVTLVSEDTSSCGLAYLMSVPSPGFAANAFSVVYSGCLASLSLIHEWGHQLGCQHDRANSVGPAAFPFAYGWRQCSTNAPMFRTIMSYACGSAVRVNYFSNPNLTYAGQPLGVDEAVDPANAADNARAINLNAGIVAAFRASVAPEIPAAPTDLTAVAPTHLSVSLSWVDASTSETCHLVERSADGVIWSAIATLDRNVTSFTDVTAAAGTDYVYRVSAANGSGSSAFSNEAFVSVPPTPAVPAPPSGLLAALVSGTVRLNWTDNSSDETGFIVERSVNGGAYAVLATVAAGVVTMTDSTVSAGSTCAYRVCSVNAVGASAPSAAASVALPAPPPASASGLTATATPTSVTVAWVDNATNESSYRLERSANGGAFLLWIVLPSNSTAYVDTSVVAGSTYAYRVVASNSSGNAAASNVASVVVPGIPPLAPTSLGGIAASRTQINLSWIDNATNETGFRVERSTNGSTWTQVATLGANVRTFNATGLRSNTTYFFRVRAFNGFGNSAYTSTVGVRTLR